MNYLLDTNVCIALLNNNRDEVRMHFEDAAEAGSTIYVSTIVGFELWYGAWNSERQARSKLRIESFFVARVQTLPFDERDAQEAGALRNELRAIGKSIGPYDLLIAAQARARNLVLVTHNLREFGRVAGLTMRDWEVCRCGDRCANSPRGAKRSEG